MSYKLVETISQNSERRQSVLVSSRRPLCSLDVVAVALWTTVILHIEPGTTLLAFVQPISILTVEESRQQTKHCYRVKGYCDP